MREIPFRPSRVIHFLPPSNPKMVAKVPAIAPTVDVLLANLEDAVPAAEKEAARAGLIEIGKAWDHPDTQLWTRVNSLDSPWGLDDLIAAVTEVGDQLDVIMIPKVEGPEDIHYVDRLLAQLEAKAGLTRPILVHAILETARGVANVEEICAASPRMQGLSLGPADLAANRRMKTTRVGGGHPGYLVREDPDPADEHAPRATLPAGPVALHDRPHGRRLRDLRRAAVLRPVRRHRRHRRLRGPVPQRLPARLRRRVEPAPGQIEIAKRVFSPPPEDVAHAQRVIEAMGDGTGAVLLDGKMEDDASVKQCQVVVELATQLAARDPELAAAYGMGADDVIARELRPRRSVLYMPAANARALEKAKEHPVRRHHLRPRGRRRARRQAARPRAGRRRGDVGGVRQPRADDPLQRAVDAVGRRRPRRRRRRRAVGRRDPQGRLDRLPRRGRRRARRRRRQRRRRSGR